MTPEDTFDDPIPSSAEPPAWEGLAAGTVLDDKFRIERLLGKGGMGAVYEVTHQHTKHRRALKLLHPQFAKKKVVVERFFREASAAGHIGHDNIIETFDAGWLSSGEPYLLMELLDGTPLAGRIEAHPEGMDLDEVLEIFEQLCGGVQAAHEAGIVHRDLKPDNIFLARGSGAWHVKVLDFGVSKFDEKLATKLTSGGSMIGTPAYMSPEQFDGGAGVEPSSDVYSMGVILYEMVTGEYPYPASNIGQLVKQIFLSAPTPARKHRADLPEGVERLLARMLTPDPQVRLATPNAVFSLLQRAVAAEHEGLRQRTAVSDPPPIGFTDTTPTDPPPAKNPSGLASLTDTELVDEEEGDHRALAEPTFGPPDSAPRLFVALGIVALAVTGVIVVGSSDGDPAPVGTSAPTSTPHASATVRPSASSLASAPPIVGATAAATVPPRAEPGPTGRPTAHPPVAAPPTTAAPKPSPSGAIPVDEAFDDAPSP